jgi:tRNA(Ile)-lysidine synthase
MPLIEQRRPGAAGALARLGSLARTDEEFLDELATQVVACASFDDAGVLFDDIDALPKAVATRALRKACWRLGTEPTALDVDRMMRGGAARCGALVAHRLPEGLAIVRDPHPKPGELTLRAGTEFESPSWGIRVRIGPAVEPHWAWRTPLPAGTAFVRSRRPGDRVRTAAGTRKISDVLIDAKVPRALRDFVPIVATGNEALAVVGLTRCEDRTELVVDVDPLDPSWSRKALWNRVPA